MDCNHISKVLEWGFNEKHDFMATLWGCLQCDATSDKPFQDKPTEEIDHTQCGEDCFGCKARNLQLNTGDAGKPASEKKLQDRLAFYRQAKKDGIQPNGTDPVQVAAAYKASETLGTAYDGGTMTRADKVTPNVAAIMKDSGAI